MISDTRALALCSFEGPRERSLPVSGGHGEGETPLPIPNRAVKPLSADGTWLARAWESRSPPVFLERIGRSRTVFLRAGRIAGFSRYDWRRFRSHSADAGCEELLPRQSAGARAPDHLHRAGVRGVHCGDDRPVDCRL